MAASVATITVNTYPAGVDNTQRNEVVRGRISFTAGTYPIGGFSLDWTGLEGIKSVPIGSSTPTSTTTPAPLDMDVKSVATPPSGVVYAVDISNNAVGKLHVYVANNGVSSNSGPLIEIGGNLPGWILNDTIAFTAYFRRG